MERDRKKKRWSEREEKSDGLRERERERQRDGAGERESV